MRRPVLLLVMLLLVLRGWMGDALAMPTAADPVRTAALPAAAAHGDGPGATVAGHGAAEHGHQHQHQHRDRPAPDPGSVHGHGGAAHAACGPAQAHPPADGSPCAGAPPLSCGEAHAGHGGCGDCQVCHSAVPAFEARVASPATGPRAAPAGGRTAFASADRSPDLRPPIGSPHRP